MILSAQQNHHENPLHVIILCPRKYGTERCIIILKMDYIYGREFIDELVISEKQGEWIEY